MKLHRRNGGRKLILFEWMIEFQEPRFYKKINKIIFFQKLDCVVSKEVCCKTRFGGTGNV